jgi:hypothetical protein
MPFREIFPLRKYINTFDKDQNNILMMRLRVECNAHVENYKNNLNFGILVFLCMSAKIILFI